MVVLRCENVSVWCIDYVILCQVSLEFQIRLFPTKTILSKLLVHTTDKFSHNSGQSDYVGSNPVAVTLKDIYSNG